MTTLFLCFSAMGKTDEGLSAAEIALVAADNEDSGEKYSDKKVFLGQKQGEKDPYASPE